MKLKHLKWMLDNMPDEKETPDKYNRWLGFMQGVLWAFEIKTIDEMREEVKEGHGFEAVVTAINERI
ncbi:MAG: hypothetical protein KAS32_28040 [Candidatus Peribacteraceae bacterium]|nr:hypothetical protein [Candidatus Peribacteraceae bacterium]